VPPSARHADARIPINFFIIVSFHVTAPDSPLGEAGAMQ